MNFMDHNACVFHAHVLHLYISLFNLITLIYATLFTCIAIINEPCPKNYSNMLIGYRELSMSE